MADAPTSCKQAFDLMPTRFNKDAAKGLNAVYQFDLSGDGGGKWYATYFFINAPYNPNLQTYASTSAPSTTEFCRQCHFGESNEANNTNNIKAQFQ